MMHKTLFAAAAGAALFATAAFAHHSNAMFDHTKVEQAEGFVKDFQWTNPHIWIELEANGPKGQTKLSIEGPAPNVLRRVGWKFNSVKTGDKILVKYHPLKDGSPGGSVMSVTDNGVTLDYASPPPVGAPAK